VGIFSVTLRTAGSQTLTATDTQNSSFTVTSSAITVNAAAVSHLGLSGIPNTATAGVAFDVTVTALDPFNNAATSYTGTITMFSSTDSNAGFVPSASTLTSGVGTFTTTLRTAGGQSVSAIDQASLNLVVTSKNILVSAGSATHLATIGVPASTSAGTGFRFTVTALDQFNNTDTAYAGTVALSSSDGSASFVPTSKTLVSGVGAFTATLATAGSQTLSANDTVASSITGSSNTVSVIAGAATHFAIIGTPGSVSAGTPFSFTVTAEDSFNNTAGSYAGTVEFSSSDTHASLPLPSTLSAGVGTFSATLVTAGSQTLTVNDLSPASISGTATITVDPLAATHFLVDTRSTVNANSSFFFTVTAEDQFNNIATDYNGNVHLTSSDSTALLTPNNSNLSAGTGTFVARFRTAGPQTITATDLTTATLAGHSGPIVVAPLSATHFTVSAAGTALIGQAFTLTVTAQDQFNNIATGYTGTVVMSSSDAGAGFVPASSTLSNGQGTFAVTMATLGSQTVSATDSNSSSITGSITVNVTAPPDHFLVTAPSNTTAGAPFELTVTAEDKFNNVLTGFNGTVSFGSSDTLALSTGVIPSSGPLTNGTGFFAVELLTSGNQTISATAGTATGTSPPISVANLAATHLVMAVQALPGYPGMASAYIASQNDNPLTSFANTGSPIVYTVFAEDQFGNADVNYQGTVGFATSDSGTGVALPGDSTLVSGAGVFSATLTTAGSQSITASDINNASITAAKSTIALRGLVVTGFTPTPSGFTVSFNQPFNPSTIAMYSPTGIQDDITLATMASQVSVRGSVIFNSPTNPTGFTFVKTTQVSPFGTFNPGATRTSGLLAAGNYTVTLRSYNAATNNGFQDMLGEALDGQDTATAGLNYVFTFSVAPPPVAVGIPDFARGPSNTDAVHLPNTIGNGNTFGLSYTNPNTSSTGTATVTFSTNRLTLQSNIQTALNNLAQIGTTGGGVPNAVVVVINDVSSGANVQVTFQNSLASATSNLLSSPTSGVSIGLATIDVANNIPGDGIPIALSNGLGVTSGSFTLEYNPSLLNITGAVSRVVGASFIINTTIHNSTSATAVLSLSSPTPISSNSGPITFGSLIASVPMSTTASYGAKQLLHFSSVQLTGNAGPISVVNLDAVQVVAYFGDVQGTGGPFSIDDADDMQSVAVQIPNTVMQTLPGFTAYPNLDPVVIGDVALQNLGYVNTTDAGAMNQQLVAPKPTIPHAPAGLPVTPTGPDPTLSVQYAVGSRQYAEGSVQHPAHSELPTAYCILATVNIDTARPVSSTGMTDAILALRFDPNVFDVSAADVQLGTVPQAGSSWQLKAEVNDQSGLIGIELYSSHPIQSSAGGSLVTIALHPRGAGLPETFASDSFLSFLPAVDPSGGVRVYQTQVSDAQGAFVLHTVGDSQAPTEESRQWTVTTEHATMDDRPAPPAGPSAAAVEQVFETAGRLADNSQLLVFEPSFVPASDLAQVKSHATGVADENMSVTEPSLLIPDLVLMSLNYRTNAMEQDEPSDTEASFGAESEYFAVVPREGRKGE
jgi:hypothetical protein